ncbi:uncharacterized protein PpBr36_11279 [Pyricularia pennisetigena]|uniref:uncharacterized protein n=1 Tax=Pyricularia pennisetigena TaxID=1578925 RepID=UPI001153B241|nr:uncharacterized protein PpBr36_11279 [Pyricularia pennisetigena]TLS20440.1 hypothetical protein PpBr36_11279 [Pyricularia pennisetigena]
MLLPIVFDIGSVPPPVQNGIFGRGVACVPSQLIGAPPLPVGRLWLSSVVGGRSIDCVGFTSFWRRLKAGSSRHWLRFKFCNRGADHGLESKALENWLESLCPPEESRVRSALRSDRRHVCTVMLDQVEKNGLTDLKTLSREAWGDFVPPHLISNGAGIIFPSIDGMLPSDDLGLELQRARHRLPQEAKCLSVYQLPPVSNHCERVPLNHGYAALWVTKALLQCSKYQENCEPLTVVVDAILDGPMLQMPAALSSQLFLSWKPEERQDNRRDRNQEAAISPNLRPKLVIAPSGSFTDAHIDMGSHGLAAIGPGVMKLWGLWPGTEKNVRMLGRLKCEAAKKAKETTTWAEFVLADAVSQLEHGIWVMTEPFDLLHMSPGTIHAVYTISGGILVGTNFVSADDVAATALAVDNDLEEKEVLGDKSKRNEFGFYFQALELCFRRQAEDGGRTKSWVDQGHAARADLCFHAAKLQKAMGFNSFVAQKAVVLASTESDGRGYRGGRPRRGVADARTMLCSECSRVWIDHWKVL